MRSIDRLSLLLIEGDDVCRQILMNQLHAKFSDLVVTAATTPDEAMQRLKDGEHDIVVCDALLARDQRINFSCQMCTVADPIVIIITADSNLNVDSFPSSVKDICVQQVAYKPVDLGELMRKVEDATERVKGRKGGT